MDRRLRHLGRGMAAAALLLAVVAAPGAAGGSTLFVDDDGLAGPGCNGNGQAYPEIQSAVDAAGPGDTIRVCPGTYPGHIMVETADLTIEAVTPETAVIVPGTF